MEETTYFKNKTRNFKLETVSLISKIFFRDNSINLK